MINTIVVEDEWYNLEEISDLIEKTGFMRVVKKYSNPIKALEEFESVSPQVAFIDIDMPEMDGIKLAEKLIEHNKSITIVFITAFNQYAVNAFDVNALDYIMKPINIQRFNNMVEKIKNKIDSSTYARPKVLRIKCFGSLETSIEGNPIKWERSKAEELFAYLLMNYSKYVHKTTIIEYLWPEYEPEKALKILQTSVYMIRKLFAGLEEYIELNYSVSKYCLIIKDVECDYIEFEKELVNYNVMDKATYKTIESISRVFDNGGFLAQQGYIWSVGKNEELKEKIMFRLKEITEVYTIEENYEELLRYLKLISKITPYDEEVNYRVFKTMEKLGKLNEITIYYEWLEKVLKNEYDIAPSERILNIFNKNDKKKCL